MARETVLVDTSLRVSKIVEVRSNVLVDFLVVFARVIDAVAHSSLLERLHIIMMLVGEVAPTRVVIRSRGGGSANQARRV